MSISHSFRQPSNSFNYSAQGCGCSSACPDKFGCPPGVAPDFSIKRHDTQPPFKVSVKDCDGPLTLSGLVLEVNMWAKAKLKASIGDDETYFRLADDIGFEQAMVGDIIIMERARLPEHMLVIGFDENNKLVQVQRGYNGTTSTSWRKGTALRIYRILNGHAITETIIDDIEQLDGTILQDQIIESFLVYEWKPNDVCLPGCYWLEFKLLKMLDLVLFTPGKTWCGETHQTSGGYYFTGTGTTDSSVRLSYNSAKDIYNLPTEVWSEAFHVHSDGYYYTGTSHDDGSVFLSRTGIPVDDDICYTPDGTEDATALSVVLASAALDLSTISFIGEGLLPEDYGCNLGEGVEWVRRFPCDAEGFLIKIIESFTPEL